MATIELTINGKRMAAQEGETILSVCKSNEIDVPTLCHYEGLPDVGACRLCIVDLNDGRRPVSSCTTPVVEGMDVSTHTPRLELLRRQTLELLFGERNHICPFCARSGNCELQDQGYRHEMDHVRFDYLSPKLPMDNSHPHIALDHNRCILCTRCVRACDHWVGAHTLDVDERGARSMIVADQNVPLGESSCVSCGTCVTVCPTGALFEKRGAHWQGRRPAVFTETICSGCGVGCRVNASVQFRQISELQSAGGPNGNRILCEKGRFGLVNPRYPRLTHPMVRVAGEFKEVQLDSILDECHRRLTSTQVQQDPRRAIALISGSLPLETINTVRSFMTNVVGSPRWVVTDRSNDSAYRSAMDLENGIPALADLADLDTADLYLTIGANLEANAGVVASYVRRGVLHRRAKLLKINPRHTWLTSWTDIHLQSERRKDTMILAALLKYLIDMNAVDADSVPEKTARQLKRLDDESIAMACGVDAASIKRMAQLYAEASTPMIICGRGLSKHGPEGLHAALNLVHATNNRNDNGRWRLMHLALQANSYGARLLGKPDLNLYDFDPQSADVAFIVIGDSQRDWPTEWLEKLRRVNYVVALVARKREDVMLPAHAIVPTAIWSEREGTFVNLEARVQHAKALTDRVDHVVPESEFFAHLASRLDPSADSWSADPLPPEIAQASDGEVLAFRQNESTEIDWTSVQELVEA
ncbi:MAG: molybdopterin-dependent oxidoreductase [Phycisphaerae bacterium]